MNIIQMSGLYKRFGSKSIFHDFNLEIKKGEMVAITGSSGCGKTTLLNMIGLIEPIDSGEYFLLGKKAPKCNTNNSNKVIRGNISYLFQNFALIDNFTVEENLMLALRYVNKSREQKKRLINTALLKVDLKNYQKKRIFEISGGEQQRVALARAILKPSDIILADEPTGALDPINRDIVLKILRELNDFGKTIVIVTHDMTAANSCDRIIQL